MYYQRNKIASRTINNKPSLTEQSGAKETDINVIVKRFIDTAQAPGSTQPPIYGDFSEIPTSLREVIERGRSIQQLMRQLPPQLKGMSKEEILALTPEQLTEKLTPKPPENPPPTE